MLEYNITYLRAMTNNDKYLETISHIIAYGKIQKYILKIRKGKSVLLCLDCKLCLQGNIYVVFLEYIITINLKSLQRTGEWPCFSESYSLNTRYNDAASLLYSTVHRLDSLTS